MWPRPMLNYSPLQVTKNTIKVLRVAKKRETSLDYSVQKMTETLIHQVHPNVVRLYNSAKIKNCHPIQPWVDRKRQYITIQKHPQSS